MSRPSRKNSSSIHSVLAAIACTSSAPGLEAIIGSGRCIRSPARGLARCLSRVDLLSDACSKLILNLSDLFSATKLGLHCCHDVSFSQILEVDQRVRTIKADAAVSARVVGVAVRANLIADCGHDPMSRVSKTVAEVSVEVSDFPDVAVSHDDVKSEEVYLASLKGGNFGF